MLPANYPAHNLPVEANALGDTHKTPARLRRGWEVQSRALRALLVRDMMMRYGRTHLGFIWVVLEPMLLTAGVLTLWAIAKGPLEHGVRVLELVLSGYMLLTLWRHLTNSPIQLLRRNIPLLHHQQIRPLDLFYARMLLEFAATTAALLLILVPLTLLGVVTPVADWALVISGWLMMLLLGAGAGSLILVATELNETTEKFIQPLQYLLIPISGSFFMVSWFPERVRELLLLNPLLHCYEMLRSGFFGPATETHYSLTYPACWGCLQMFIGLTAMSRLHRNLQIA